MEYVLKNERAVAKFRDYGGELTEFTVDGINYIWNGNPDFWKYHAPVLFPIVCKLKNGQFIYDGKVYKQPSHGFGRISVHKVAAQDAESITFNLPYSEETLENYPFKFDFKIKYVLNGTELKVFYIVENLDDKTLYFSVGGHTAFMCPFNEGENQEDYYLEFSENETADTMVSDENGMIVKERKPCLNNEKVIEIKQRQALIDTIILDELKSSKVCLKSRKSENYLEFDFTGFPYLAFWSIEEDAPFVCIEPWYGLPDESDTEGDFTKKLGIVTLEPGKKFECLQKFTVR